MLRRLVLIPLILFPCWGYGAPLVHSKQSPLSDRVASDLEARQAAPRSDVIVQLFNWPFQAITEEMPNLAAIGYGQVHVSPPNLTVDTNMWYGRYQPVDYRLIAGPLGNEEQFRLMIKTAHQYGVRIIVDLVLNHTASVSFPQPPEAEAQVQDQGPLFTADDYHENVCITDYNDVYQVRNFRLSCGPGDMGLPDLKQSSPRVLQVQQEFIARLNAMDVDGYRFDAMKHMEPDYFARLLTPTLQDGKFLFGEIIAGQASYDRDLGPYLAATTMSLYDFPLRETIQQAFFLSGKLSSLLDSQLVESRRALPAERSVSFVMNHDIPNNQGFRYMILDPIDEELAYEFLLGRQEGVPYVYSDLGSQSGAGLIDDRWNRAHQKPAITRMVKFHNFVRGEATTVLAADACMIALQRGSKGVVAINKCGGPLSFSLQGRFPEGTTFFNLVDQTSLSLSAATAQIVVPARSSVPLIVGLAQ